MKEDVREMKFDRCERRTMRIFGLFAVFAPTWAYRFLLQALDELDLPDDVVATLVSATKKDRPA